MEVETTPILLDVLHRLDRWRSLTDIKDHFAGYSFESVRSTLTELRARTFVVEQFSRQAEQEDALVDWEQWGVEGRLFHFLTKKVEFEPISNKASLYRSLLRRAPLPAPDKKYRGAKRVRLSKPPIEELRGEFSHVLLSRRTHRDFGRGTVSAQEVATLLSLTWGITSHRHIPGLGKVRLKTSPSGGARHSLEVYPLVRKVKGLRRGWYHYRPDLHQLEILSDAPRRARIVQLIGNQDWVGDCSVLFVMTAVFPRVMWKYKNARAYRVVLLEAGHFCQTFCLAATWLGLAPFSTAALADEEIERELQIDGAKESVLYVAGVGPKAEG